VTISESISLPASPCGPTLSGDATLPARARGAEVTEDLERLVERMREGDEHSLKLLYEATVGKVHAVSRAILRDPQDAEENTCETFASAWASAARFDTTRGGVMTWLLLLCRSRAIDKLRHRRRQPTMVDMESVEAFEPVRQPGPEDWLDLVQQGTRAHEALSSLSLKRRRLVGLAFLQGLTHSEIAQHCGMPLGTVKSHLRRALNELRVVLDSP
jgi:RNA polymerase sigma factor (sigma-70 family)